MVEVERLKEVAKLAGREDVIGESKKEKKDC